MAELELKHIFKDYIPGEHAVTNFDLTINDGEFIVLVGPSGCGKSTTLRMIAGLEEITSGQILLDGKDITDNHPKDRDIAMVFQSYALYPHMTVRENMGFGLKMRNITKEEIDSTVENAAQTIGMDEFLEKLPKELSGGQRQRVALGRAIVRNPEIFLMDEPLSNLDAKLRVHTRAEISQLHKNLGTTTIYVTHDQVEAMTMADRIVVMNLGHIQQVGTPREIYLKPRNMFVAGFIGSPAMNFIQVKLVENGLIINGEQVAIPANIHRQLAEQGYLNKEITLGVRPENIFELTDTDEVSNQPVLTIKVLVAEMLGYETLIHFDLGSTRVIAKLITLDEFEIGEQLQLSFNWDTVHFFDPMNDGERIEISKNQKVSV
ncbi:ABC transporter ATP-binding protein [Fundicoccus culcitae]|uniref:Sn-glycerol-3-phosphate ABC transporter ATP-binding protein UgpC n=1 Tax=Fundicoccus culcitae TaxID=2969821 RepID=A0ABY5P561_9LACT|nr:sn-glycerol-3-phosphate ABC transporter ATP-binding protein UgpC [Fundicoccus culcitae]UUX33745.1 sn-glycerol-3-phosphate ABC transporter ATP-binding protein UgpC [Fundicoccus culcitae]